MHEAEAYDAARKASATATELDTLAARLDAHSVVDRIATLERQISASRTAAKKLAGLDD